MLTEFEKKIADFSKSANLFGQADKVLLAVSGGADSTALLYAMHAIKANGCFSGELICAHINHRLRAAQSDGDADFVLELSEKLNIKLITRTVDVKGFAGKNKLSIETAARQLRIENLIDIASDNDCKYIATAHHADDNAETIIQRLTRGTGLRGLGGISPIRKFGAGVYFVRPLLCIRRNQIIDYLTSQNLAWRTDASNLDCKHRRNFIRHKLLPYLQNQCESSLVEQLSKLANSARGFDSKVCSDATKNWQNIAKQDDNTIQLNLEKFLPLHPAVKVELIRRSLKFLGSGERDLRQQHFERIMQLAEDNVSGKKIELPGKFTAYREYGDLVFTGLKKTRQNTVGSMNIEIGGQNKFGPYTIEADILKIKVGDFEKFRAKKNKFIEWFDVEKLNFPLKIRFRVGGERFWPLGAVGNKKVGKFLTTVKVGREIRENVLIIADSEKAIWVLPVRISEEAKVLEGTKKVLQLRILT